MQNVKTKKERKRKKHTNELTYKTEIDPQMQKMNLWLLKGTY